MHRTLKLSLFALVLVGLVGGSFAYLVAQKSVTITVDGSSREVSTYAATAGEVLSDEDIQIAADDVVLPSVDSAVDDGDTVVLNRARPLELTVDGVTSTVTTTALSVDEALDQLGYRGDGLVLSASRSERLPLDGMALQVTTPKTVTVIADGVTRDVSTTAGTAADLLAEQGLTLSATDRVQPLPDRPADGPHGPAGVARPGQRGHRDPGRGLPDRGDRGPGLPGGHPRGDHRGSRGRAGHHLHGHGDRRGGDQPRGRPGHRDPRPGRRAGLRRDRRGTRRPAAPAPSLRRRARTPAPRPRRRPPG